MSAAASPFLKFLHDGLDRGGFETDDVLAAVLPLMRQTADVHETGQVAPLKGVQQLIVNDEGHLAFDATKAIPPEKAASRIEELQVQLSHAVEVVAESGRTTNIDTASVEVSNFHVGQSGQEIKKPVYLPGYVCWEQAVGHHDQLTDIYSLGMILASLACGLDLTDPGDLEIFADSRENLFAVNSRLHPVVVSVIVQMTELNRHKRAQDLPQLIDRLKRYREQPSELDLSRIKGFKESNLGGKRRLIQSHLRDRLFEISRRNRLIYFKPTLQTLNLTIASVPLVLDYRNIKLEQLFVWHKELAATIIEGAPMSLGSYLRFEDAPYIPSVLDKIISEARRDRAEYGFAQLRLVLCFLRWHNLKEAPGERILSPLLLLPVELKKKKGVRDNYVLDPTSSEAEVNPSLRHHLKELYNLSLPEFVDLRETSMDQFYEALQAQIRASEPAVTLNKIDRPQIELIHERARQRTDQYRRRMQLKLRRARNAAPIDYSYDRENLRPRGLQIFLEKVRPTPAPLRHVAGAPPVPRLPHILPASSVFPDRVPPDGAVHETERKSFALRDGEGQNPYSWDFDLCSLTLGNFHYRKMTLVRDYSNLIETDMASGAFDTVFSLTPKTPEESAPPPLELPDQHLIISCDAAQASAIARARTGRSYIIQGPPGTGKSQTITNLIADYVARGKRVLFVCEKRAAIDIVFHRLRQQGLDELCCLIHDSQTDKKEFIFNLKQTYEKFLAPMETGEDAEKERASSLEAMEQDLAGLQRFSTAMRETHPNTGIPLRSLLHRLVELSCRNAPLTPELEEQLPDYPLWMAHGEVVDRLGLALRDLGEEPCFAKHPARWLGTGILNAERPLETLGTLLDKAEDLLDAVESALELSGLPPELWDTIEEIQTILEFAVQITPLAERGLLGLLSGATPASDTFAKQVAELDERGRGYWQAHEKTVNWKEPLSPDDTQNALTCARAFEKSFFRFLQPAFWQLRKTLRARYDFSKHAVAPSWVKILEELAAEQQALAAYQAARQQAQKDWRCDDPDKFKQTVAELRGAPDNAHPSARALVPKLIESADAKELV
ncbi:MAG TPA: DUF4011 domain-containing protein, partial [Verrucomicrobiae bacterium]|nr:DUF4011 domain-containing protein [Verrucomicrobiae bacterium]